jgi:hypothetical protein
LTKEVLIMAERTGKNGKPLQRAAETPTISKLGQRLREISDKALASGTKTLSLDEIHDYLAEVRGGR